MKKKIQLTEKGLEELKKELEELVSVKRPKMVERLAYARSQGDLSENSDYANAKEELEFIDGRIEELEDVTTTAEVVKNGGNGSGIGVGTKITVRTNGNKIVFDMVGEWEADPMNKKISPESPIGQALFGKKVGEKVEVEVPAGKLKYEILAIE